MFSVPSVRQDQTSGQTSQHRLSTEGDDCGLLPMKSSRPCVWPAVASVDMLPELLFAAAYCCGPPVLSVDAPIERLHPRLWVLRRHPAARAQESQCSSYVRLAVLPMRSHLVAAQCWAFSAIREAASMQLRHVQYQSHLMRDCFRSMLHTPGMQVSVCCRKAYPLTMSMCTANRCASRDSMRTYSASSGSPSSRAAGTPSAAAAPSSRGPRPGAPRPPATR